MCERHQTVSVIAQRPSIARDEKLIPGEGKIFASAAHKDLPRAGTIATGMQFKRGA